MGRQQEAQFSLRNAATVGVSYLAARVGTRAFNSSNQFCTTTISGTRAPRCRDALDSNEMEEEPSIRRDVVREARSGRNLQHGGWLSRDES